MCKRALHYLIRCISSTSTWRSAAWPRPYMPFNLPLGHGAPGRCESLFASTSEPPSKETTLFPWTTVRPKGYPTVGSWWGAILYERRYPVTHIPGLKAASFTERRVISTGSADPVHAPPSSECVGFEALTVPFLGCRGEPRLQENTHPPRTPLGP